VCSRARAARAGRCATVRAAGGNYRIGAGGGVYTLCDGVVTPMHKPDAPPILLVRYVHARAHARTHARADTRTQARVYAHTRRAQVSDLDGTVVGNDAALARFKQYWEVRARARLFARACVCAHDVCVCVCARARAVCV
jgi:hypothetical protein